MNEKAKKAMDDWLQGRPACVKKLAEEFPPFTILKKVCQCHGETVIVGYNEDDQLIVSEIDMFGCFDVGKSKLYVKAQDIRDGKVQIERREPYDRDAGKDTN